MERWRGEGVEMWRGRCGGVEMWRGDGERRELPVCLSLQMREEKAVAVKTCKSDAAHEDRVKFLEEAGMCVYSLCVCVCVCVCV